MLRIFFKNWIGGIGAKNLPNRQEWVKNSLLALSADLSILDIGAGEQQYKKYCTHLKYTSQDFNQYTGSGNGIGFQTGVWDTSKIDIVSDIISIPQPDAFYDAILCTEVIEHVPDPISAIREFKRLLKPGGELILSAPFSSFTHFAPYHFCTGFNKYFYEHHLEGKGFEILETSPNGDYSHFLAQEIRRILSFYGKTPWYLKVACFIILRFLYVKSKMVNTQDFGCFGYHVRAKRVTDR